MKTLYQAPNPIKIMESIRYLGWMCAIVLFQNWVFDLLSSILEPDTPYTHTIRYWWASVFISPIIETLLFQALGCWILNRLGCSRVVTLAGVALIFGLAHFQADNPITDMVSAVGAGLIFGWMFLRRLLNGQTWRGVAEVSFVHIFNNAAAYIYAINCAPESLKYAV